VVFGLKPVTVSELTALFVVVLLIQGRGKGAADALVEASTSYPVAVLVVVQVTVMLEV
jgi:hypothetical protein